MPLRYILGFKATLLVICTVLFHGTVFGVIESKSLSFMFSNTKVEPLGTTFLVCLILLVFYKCKDLAINYIPVIVVTVVVALWLILTYPLVDINHLYFESGAVALYLINHNRKLYLRDNYSNSNSNVRPLYAIPYAITLLAAANLTFYKLFGDVLFRVNLDLFALIIQAFLSASVIHYAKTVGVITNVKRFILPALISPLIIIDVARTIDGGGIYIASLMMLFILIGITHIVGKQEPVFNSKL